MLDGEPTTDPYLRAEDRAITTRTLRVWLRDDAIVQAVGLPGIEQSRADAEENIAVIWEVAGQKHRPLLADMRWTKGMDRGARSYYANLPPDRHARASAILIGSPLTRMIAGFVLGLVQTHVTPSRVFTSEAEAVAWLRGFCK